MSSSPQDIFINIPEFERTDLLDTFIKNKVDLDYGKIGSDGSIYIAGFTKGNLDGDTSSSDLDQHREDFPIRRFLSREP